MLPVLQLIDAVKLDNTGLSTLHCSPVYALHNLILVFVSPR